MFSYKREGYDYGIILNPNRYLKIEDFNSDSTSEKVYQVPKDIIIPFSELSGLSIHDLLDMGIIEKDTALGFVIYSTIELPKETDTTVIVKEEHTWIHYTHRFTSHTVPEHDVWIDRYIRNHLLYNFTISNKNILKAIGFIESYHADDYHETTQLCNNSMNTKFSDFIKSKRL